MCGVCGIVSLGEPIHGDRTRESVDAMVRALAHRGPDDSGVASNSGGILGATRLAIRGLHSGRQPIVDEATGLIVVCNGEIDNHRDLRRWLETRGRPVKLETDIAVISGLYLELGEEFVERLVGVFAIAIWDTQKQRLLLARDRAGERPLFFTTADGVIHFATEMAALATDVTSNRTLAQSAVAEYLQYGSVVAPRTLFAEIEKVAPGEMVVIDSAGTRRRRYWRWGIGRVPKTAPSVEAFDQVFRRAVARQSDIDVPYGVFLSGGIDSSLVAAVARSVRPGSPLTAYSLRFGEESYDEGEFAGQVAKQLGLSPVSVWVKPEVLPEMVAELIDSVGEPLADPAWIPTALLARRAAQDVKLALVGEGADELFGGYPTYLGARVGEHYARLPGPVRALLRRAIEAWPVTDKKVTISALLKRFVQGPADDGVARHLTWTSNISPALLKRLGLEPIRSRVPGALPGDLLDAVQQIDLETSLAEGLLTKADRATMLSALEVRSPFLDHAVMEFAATLPGEQRVRGLTTKAFLKEYAQRYLPASIIHRRKRGLSVPLSAWLRGPLQEWARVRLSSPLLAGARVDRSAALELFQEHLRREADHARAIWALAVYSEWLQWAARIPGKKANLTVIPPASVQAA